MKFNVPKSKWRRGEEEPVNFVGGDRWMIIETTKTRNTSMYPN